MLSFSRNKLFLQYFMLNFDKITSFSHAPTLAKDLDVQIFIAASQCQMVLCDTKLFIVLNFQPWHVHNSHNFCML